MLPSAGTGPEEQAEQHTVLKQLMEKMAEKASSLLHALQVTDVSQSGLVSIIIQAVSLCWTASQPLFSLCLGDSRTAVQCTAVQWCASDSRAISSPAEPPWSLPYCSC